ncbi:MAG: hypothetical protein FWB88_00885 [Defluviitaleaceae bacterium]|nr:hypothetical protein [Defluviitaleaceae bacterium]MCL2238351.1 hypothetical protein [Defluviitaleaceae bacterium]
MNILAVIPARGNSKGIPRKNMRLMHGKPLLFYSIATAKKCKYITQVAVSSEDAEILEYAQSMGVTALPRSIELSGDDITLDPVVYDGLVKMEAHMHCAYDYIITMQPTSPLLSALTLESAIECAVSNAYETLISATNKPSLSWRREGDSILPNYQKRLNRQRLPANYIETGAFVVSKRHVVTNATRIGKYINVYELPGHEIIDIDTMEDWFACEALMNRKRIVFRADGSRELGMGHIYRCLTLAYELTGHDIYFVCDERYLPGIEKIEGSYFYCYKINSSPLFYSLLDEIKPDIVVVDMLNTHEADMKEIKTRTGRLVTLEDLGTGTHVADAVVNELYTNKDSRPHVYTGHKYACLREEFLRRMPKPFSPQVKNIFIMFGGSDPSNLTKKVYEMVCNYNAQLAGICFNFITGLAYDYEVNCIVDNPEKNIYVHNNTHKVSWFMQQADLAISSKGRGTMELASMAVPAIVLAANNKEKSHGFAKLENGFVNLGSGADISEQTLFNTLKWLIDTPQTRKEMRELMLGLDLTNGINRVKKIILGDK